MIEQNINSARVCFPCSPIIHKVRSNLALLNDSSIFLVAGIANTDKEPLHQDYFSSRYKNMYPSTSSVEDVGCIFSTENLFRSSTKYVA